MFTENCWKDKSIEKEAVNGPFKKYAFKACTILELSKSDKIMLWAQLWLILPSQCDHLAILFFQNLAIENNEKLPKV